MKKLMKSCLAAAMALALCVSLLPMTVFAEEADSATCPSCGAPATLTYTNNQGCVNGVTYTYRCNDGHYYGVTISGPGHNYENGKCTVCGEGDPDYTAPDKTETCDVCGAELVDNRCPNKREDGTHPADPETCEHVAGDWASQGTAGMTMPTCEEPGSKTEIKTCKICLAKLDERTVDFGSPRGHSWDDGEVTTEPTATEKGVMTYTCTRTSCGATRTEDIDPVPDTAEPGTETEECAHENGVWMQSGLTKHMFICADCGNDVLWHDVVPSEADCLNPSHSCTYENCGLDTMGAKNPEKHAKACALSYVDNGDGTHDQVRTCDAVEVDDEAHEDLDGDKLCDKCGAEMQDSEPEEPQEPVGPTKTDENTWTWTSPEGTVVTVTLNGSASGHSATIFRTVQVNVDGNSNSAVSIDGVDKGYGKSAQMTYPIDPSVDATKKVSVSVGQYSFTVEFDMTQGIEVIEAHHYEGDWIVDKEATETEEGHAYRTCTVKMINGKDCPVKEEKIIPMLESGDNGDDNQCTKNDDCTAEEHDPECPKYDGGDNGDNGDGGDDNGPTNPGTTPTTPTNPGTTTGGGTVTDPDPVASTGELTEIGEEEVPLAGLPFDLEATDELTRGLVAQILYWFEGEPDAGQSSFTDVAEDHEYAQAIAWGDANGILLGYGDGTYRPDNCITREEMELILNRYARYKESKLVMELEGEPDDLMIWAEAEEILNDFFDRLSGEEV